MAKRLISQMVVYGGDSPTGDESATYIEVIDEGGGPFFEITQPGMVDFVSTHNVPTLRLNFTEVDEITDVLKTIRAQWEMAGLA